MPDGPADKRDLDLLRVHTKDPEKYAALTEAVADRQRDAGFLVVLGTHTELPAEAGLAAFAEAMEWDVYTARQRLLTPTPRIIRRETTMKAAEDFAARLRGCGCRAFSVAEESLAHQSFIPIAAVWEERGVVVLDDFDGKRHKVAVDDVVCVVLGEVAERVVSEASQAGLMTGADIRTSRDSAGYHTETWIDIHRRSSPASFRISQDTFRFQRVFPGKEGGSSVLLRELLRRLRNTLIGTPFYEDFGRVQDVLGTSRQLLGTSQYLVRNWLRPGLPLRVQSQSTTRESNAEAFLIYSTLARMEGLRESGTGRLREGRGLR